MTLCSFLRDRYLDNQVPYLSGGWEMIHLICFLWGRGYFWVLRLFWVRVFFGDEWCGSICFYSTFNNTNYNLLITTIQSFITCNHLNCKQNSTWTPSSLTPQLPRFYVLISFYWVFALVLASYWQSWSILSGISHTSDRWVVTAFFLSQIVLDVLILIVTPLLAYYYIIW